MDALAGAGKAAGIHDGNEAAQKLQIEHLNAPFKNPLEASLSFNFQISRRGPRSWAKETSHVARAPRRSSPHGLQPAPTLYRGLLPALELRLCRRQDRGH